MGLVGTRTSSLPRTHGAVARITGVATYIAHFRIDKPFALEVFAEQVLHAPEAACGNGAFLSSVWDLSWRFWIEREAGGCCEGAEEALDEGWHLGCHDEDCDEKQQTRG